LIQKAFKHPLSLIDSMEESTGVAYLILKCKDDANIEDLQWEATWIKSATPDMPSELELTLVEGLSNLATEDDPELTTLLKDQEERGLTHGFKATLNCEGNRKVAEYLADFSQYFCAEVLDIIETTKKQIYAKRPLIEIAYQNELTRKYILLNQ
jgi:hypothetical protein